MVEIGTKICNVKGLNADQITEKLRRKFADVGMVAETDFSSFESCIGPDLKHVCENHIYRRLATTEHEQSFIDEALDREEVHLIGPCFEIPHFHHIRMSGDYWTSLGNLLSNIVLISYITGRPVREVMETGLFEGDDGAFPAPEDVSALERRVQEAGVILTFDVAPWQSLSFCGNHFEMVDGTPIRFRDPYRSIMSMTVLYSPPRGTLRHDMMLQRSKALSYLSGPVIKEAFVVAAIIERFTRNAKVDELRLKQWGLMKAYSNHGTESCVPQWLVSDQFGHPISDSEFVRVVHERNRAAGGQCDKATIWKMIKAAREQLPEAMHIVLPPPCPPVSNRDWLARDGSQFTHKERNLIGVQRIVYNDVQSRDTSSFRRLSHASPGKPEITRRRRNNHSEYWSISDLIAPMLMIVSALSIYSFFALGLHHPVDRLFDSAYWISNRTNETYSWTQRVSNMAARFVGWKIHDIDSRYLHIPETSPAVDYRYQCPPVEYQPALDYITDTFYQRDPTIDTFSDALLHARGNKWRTFHWMNDCARKLGHFFYIHAALFFDDWQDYYWPAMRRAISHIWYRYLYPIGDIVGDYWYDSIFWYVAWVTLTTNLMGYLLTYGQLGFVYRCALWATALLGFWNPIFFVMNWILLTIAVIRRRRAARAARHLGLRALADQPMLDRDAPMF